MSEQEQLKEMRDYVRQLMSEAKAQRRTRPWFHVEEAQRRLVLARTLPRERVLVLGQAVVEHEGWTILDDVPSADPGRGSLGFQFTDEGEEI